jgi:DNA-binding transcriptional LysR family regulator
VTLGILQLVPRRWIARALAHFKQRHPDISIGLREGDNAALSDELRWGALDLIAGALAPKYDGGFVHEALFADPYVVVARQHHPLMQEPALRADMLTRYAWIVPSHTLPRRRVLEAFFETLPTRPDIWLDTSSPGTMMTIVAETDCITLLSRAQILTDDPAHLAVLPVQVPDNGRTVGLTSRADWLPTLAQRDFLLSLKETMPR